MGKVGCDDEQMVAHITELLVDLNHRQESNERGLEEGEGEGDGEGEGKGEGEQVDRTSIMDTTS